MPLGPMGNRDNGHDRTWSEMNGTAPKQQKAKDHRTGVKKHNRDIALLKKVNWDVYQHDQLYDMIWSAKPEVMSQQSDDWRAVAKNIETITQQVQDTMRTLMDGWHGTAAVSSAASSTKLTQWAGDASHTATRIAAGLANYTEAVQYAQSHMPEPAFADAEHNFKAGYTVVGTGGPSTAVLLRALLDDHLASHQQARERKAEAVRVMENYESQSRDVHDSLPHFDDPVPGVPNPPPPAPPKPPVPPQPPVSHPTPGDSEQHQVPPPLPSPLDQGIPRDATTASNVDPSFGSGGYPGSGYGGGQSGYGSVGAVPGGGVDATRGGAGGLGGPLAARAGEPGGAAGLAGLRGTAGGAGGMGAMYPPMAGMGAPGEDDKEHKDKYDQGLDLFDDLPPAYPPVFGA